MRKTCSELADVTPKIILAGLGLHARRIYYPSLENIWANKLLAQVYECIVRENSGAQILAILQARFEYLRLLEYNPVA